MKTIILASKSPYRKQLLARLNLSFSCHDSGLDESLLKASIKDPAILTQKLATSKAAIIQQSFEDAVIIGSDQVCCFDDKILGKTGSLEKSHEQLSQMQGKTHRLITSYTILAGEKVITHTNTTELKMRKLSSHQIKNYLSQDNPIDCAGSYKLELSGICLMESIKTTDHTAIIGLPLIQLCSDLISLGVSIPSKF